MQRAAKGGKAFNLEAFIETNPLLNRDAAAKEELLKRLGIKIDGATAGASAGTASAATEATGNAGRKLLNGVKGTSTSAGTSASAGTAAGGAATSAKGLLPPPPKTGGSKGFLGGLVDGLKSFAKTKKGKLGLAAAAIAAIVTGGIYLYNRNKDHDIPVSDSSPINDLAKEPVKGTMTAQGPYTVAKGDNIWCIARSHLMELHKDDKDYKPTDVEILKRTEEIMQLNNLQYEKDCYRVIIQPNQSLKLVA